LSGRGGINVGKGVDGDANGTGQGALMTILTLETCDATIS